MAHGYEDWGGAAPQTITAPVTDMGELAARLRSIDVYDRRGNVILADDFSGGAQTIQFTSATANESYEWTNQYRRTGLGAVKTNVVAAGGSYGELGMFAPLSVKGKVGYEVSVSMQADIGYLQLVVGAVLSTAPALGYIKVDPVNNKIQVYNGGVGWVNLDDTSWLVFNPIYFNSMKVVIDLTTGKYIRFMLNGKSYNLSSYSLYAAGVGNPQSIAFYVDTYGDGAHPSWSVVDDVILTINEP